MPSELLIPHLRADEANCPPCLPLVLLNDLRRTRTPVESMPTGEWFYAGTLRGAATMCLYPSIFVGTHPWASFVLLGQLPDLHFNYRN